MATTIAPIQGSRVGPLQQGEAQARPVKARETERWISLLGGGALALYGLTRGSVGGLGLALLGGALAYRGTNGGTNALSALGVKRAASGGVRVEETVSVLRSPEELYNFWRNFENLPRCMRYLESVRATDGGRSHWVARGPLNVRVEWDAEVTAERPHEFISWRSLPGSAVDTEGTVRFQPAPANRGTWVKIVLRYDPPTGKVGAVVARLFGRSAEQEIREDLRRFKRLMETGEIPTTRGQPSGQGRVPWEQTGVMVLQDRFAKGLGWFSIGLGLAEFAAPQAVADLVGVSDHRAVIRLLGARELATGIGIFARRPRPAGWLWGRVAGDALDLTLLGRALESPNAQRTRTAAATAAVLGVTALDLLASLQHSCSPGATPGGGPKNRTWRASTRHAGNASSGR